MKRLNNYKEADIEEGGKEVTSVMGQKKKRTDREGEAGSPN